MSALEWRAGDSFDMATVLASMLLGVGYNAFVVGAEAVKGRRRRRWLGVRVGRAWGSGRRDFRVNAARTLEFGLKRFAPAARSEAPIETCLTPAAWTPPPPAALRCWATRPGPWSRTTSATPCAQCWSERRRRRRRRPRRVAQRCVRACLLGAGFAGLYAQLRSPRHGGRSVLMAWVQTLVPRCAVDTGDHPCQHPHALPSRLSWL